MAISQASPVLLFQLTTSHRGRPPSRRLLPDKQYFNSLPHTEVDHLNLEYLIVYKYFNSLPHTEVDEVLP